MPYLLTSAVQSATRLPCVGVSTLSLLQLCQVECNILMDNHNKYVPAECNMKLKGPGNHCMFRRSRDHNCTKKGRVHLHSVEPLREQARSKHLSPIFTKCWPSVQQASCLLTPFRSTVYISLTFTQLSISACVVF